jgi:hypothetical protein
MITDRRGRIKCISKEGVVKFLSPKFVASDTFRVLGWKVIETPEVSAQPQPEPPVIDFTDVFNNTDDNGDK